MIGIGVIGYGYWGPNLVRNFNQAGTSQIIAVSDLRPERLAQVRARYPTVKTTTDHRDLLANPRIDAIAIATPVATHFELASQALQANKHVLVEKPITGTSDQALRLIEEAAARNLVLMVDHTFVYTGAVRKVKELTERGDLGDLYYYDSVRVNLGQFQHDVNVVWDLAPHDLSIMDYVLPYRPRAVSASGIRHIPGQPEDIAYLTLFFDEPFIAHFHVNWLAPVKVRRTLLGGSHKMIVYDDLEPSEKVKVYDTGITVNGPGESVYRMLIEYRTGDMWAPNIDRSEALHVEALHFLQCIQDGRQPITDGATGLRVVRVLEAADLSLANQGKAIELGPALVGE